MYKETGSAYLKFHFLLCSLGVCMRGLHAAAGRFPSCFRASRWCGSAGRGTRSTSIHKYAGHAICLYSSILEPSLNSILIRDLSVCVCMTQTIAADNTGRSEFFLGFVTAVAIHCGW